MRLPEYSGKFPVGAVDIEVPARKRRDFVPEYIDPVRMNKLSHKTGKGLRLGERKMLLGELRKAHDGAAHNDDAEATQVAWENTLRDVCGRGYRLKTTTLHQRTSLFTMYYPAKRLPRQQEKRHPHVRWLGRPKRRMGRVAWRYLGQYGHVGQVLSPSIITLLRAQIAARVGLPLADPKDVPSDLGRGLAGDAAKQQETKQFPVAVFCHGLAGNRLAYSQFCGELASQGFIVIAVEHRDGSGMGSFVWTSVGGMIRERNKVIRPSVLSQKFAGAAESTDAVNEALGEPSSDTKEAYKDMGLGLSKVPYLPFEQVGLAAFTQPQGEKEVRLRQTQLAMRRSEIFEALYVLRRLNEGGNEWLARSRSRSLGAVLCGKRRFERMRRTGVMPRTGEFLKSFVGKMEVENPALLGHSFGGATLFELLRTEQEDFGYGIILDPWVEPVRDPVEDESVRGKLRKPVYVINSEGFTMWRDMFAKLQRVLIDAFTANPQHRGWLLTMCGTNHGDFSDLPFLLPHVFGSTVRASEAIHTFAEACVSQIRLCRQQKHLEDIREGRVPDDLGDSKALIKMGGEHVNSDPHAPRPSTTGLSHLYDHAHMLMQPRKKRFSNMWELKGWASYAEHVPNSRANRRLQRSHARAERKAQRQAEREHQKHSGQGDDGSRSQHEEHSNAEEDEGALENPVFIDPRKDPDSWNGTTLDSDVREVFSNLTFINKIDSSRPPPYSLVTLILWYLGIKSGLAPAGHVLVHEV